MNLSMTLCFKNEISNKILICFVVLDQPFASGGGEVCQEDGLVLMRL